MWGLKWVEGVEWLLSIEQGNWFKVIDVRFGLLWIWWKALYLGMWTNRIQIYMKEFKLRALKTSPHQLDEWYWYIDSSKLKCKDEQSERILVHLNSVKPGVIVFPKEDQENDILPVLNLKQKVDRKTKQVECMVDYEKTHTYKQQCEGKVQTNSPPCMKKGIKILLTERGRYFMCL